MGDVIDSTLLHINNLPIPIPIHQRGLNLMKHDYLSSPPTTITAPSLKSTILDSAVNITCI